MKMRPAKYWLHIWKGDLVIDMNARNFYQKGGCKVISFNREKRCTKMNY